VFGSCEQARSDASMSIAFLRSLHPGPHGRDGLDGSHAVPRSQLADRVFALVDVRQHQSASCRASRSARSSAKPPTCSSIKPSSNRLLNQEEP